jgi:RNA polymerase sigma factor (sigma-70 family)
MCTMSDWELLQAYAKHRSEDAFSELVRHHLNWVYSVARRQVGDQHLAEDVAQSVFVLLARKANNLPSGTILSGWLFRTTRFVSARAMRTEQRRKKREEIASAMITTSSPDDNQMLWNQLTPHLDQAVAALSETDRSAILLRFYEKKPLREVGERLGMSEEAAKKRVSRAVEKMREFLTRRGVVLGGAGLIAVLAEQTVQAAPATLAVTVLKASVAGASASAVLPQLARETLNVWRLAKLKLVAGVALVSVTGIVLTVNMATWRTHDAALHSSTDKWVAAVIRATESGAAPTPSPESHAITEQAPATKRSINIHVVEAQTKQPLAGVEIGVERADQKTTGLTDEEGHYQVELPEKDPANLSVTAHKDGFVPMRVDWRTQDGTFRLPQEFTFTLEPSTSIGGVVQNEQGDPIASASVSLSFDYGIRGGSEDISIDAGAFKKAVPDGLGRWRFDQAPADLRGLTIRLAHPDYMSDFFPNFPNNTKLPDGKLRDMTAVMVMKKGLTVEGVVLDEQGRPIAGASVGLGKGRSYVDFLGTNTDSTGAFRFNNAPHRESVPSGETFLAVQARGYAPDLKRLDVRKVTTPIEFRLSPGHIIRGRVVDTQGNPLAGVSVVADTWRDSQTLEWHTKTDAEGSFEWTDAPADDVKFDIFKTGYRDLRGRMLPPDSENIVVTLKPPFTVHGSVTDAETGQSITSFKITFGQLDKERAEPYWLEYTQRSFSDGQYEWNLGDALGGSRGCVLRAEAEGYATEVSPPFEQEGESFVHDFKLARAIWIQGAVRTPEGQPAANVQVFLVSPGQPLMVENGHGESGQTATSIRTGADGRFKFSPTDKPFLIVALHDIGYAQAASEHAGTLPDLLLRPWARIDGAMYIGSRAAVRQKVNLWSDWSRKFDQPSVLFEANTMTDDTGHFLMDHVPAGEVYVGRWICLNERSWSFTTTHSVHVHTDFGQTAHVTIGGTGRPVVGQLVVPAGFEWKVDWGAYNSSSLHTKMPERPQPTLPNNWASMTQERRQAWYNQWQNAWNNSDEGRAYRKPFREYPFAVRPDGSFRVEDVLPGTYELTVFVSEPRTNGVATVGQPIAYLKREFTVPEMPEGRSDEPLDLGELTLEPIER